jgi:DNA polymerase III subunit delta
LLYIFFGADDFSSHEALSNIKKNLCDAETLNANTTWLEGDRLSPAELQAATQAYPFLGENRLVIVDGLLTRSEGKPKTGTARKNAKEEKTPPYLAFAAVMKALPLTTVLVLLDGKLEMKNPVQNHPLLKELIGAAEIRVFEPLPAPRLQEWIKKRVGQGNGAIADEAVTLLVKLVGANLWVMAGEVEKLILFTGGRRIEVQDVTQAVAASREIGIFELVDAVMEGRATQAQQLLVGLWQSGQSGSYILFMLARQLRLLVRAKDMLAQGRGEDFIRVKLGLVGFTLHRTLEQARRHTLPRFKDFYTRLLDTDLALKTSRYDEELALSLLVAETCQVMT